MMIGRQRIQSHAGRGYSLRAKGVPRLVRQGHDSSACIRSADRLTLHVYDSSARQTSSPIYRTRWHTWSYFTSLTIKLYLA